MRMQAEKRRNPKAGESASGFLDQNRYQEKTMNNSTQVAASRAITVPFHGADLYVVEHNGQPYTPMKPIVEGIGLDWGGQHKKVAANESRWGISVLEIPSAGGVQLATCILLRKLPAWLATVEPGKVKNSEVRARVIQYQNECDDVLWQYWNDGLAINPRALYSVNPGDVLTKEEADTLRQMVEGMAKKLSADTKVQGKFILQAWSKLKSHFKVSYREIPRQELTEAISIINRHTVEWELVDEAPQQPQPQQEIDVAALLLSGQCDPKPLTAAQHMLIDQCAGRLVGEAYPLIRAHLERRVAWNSNAAQQNSAEATQAILGGATLGNCLAHHYRNELQAAHTVMQVVRQRLDAALGSIIQPLGLSH